VGLDSLSCTNGRLTHAEHGADTLLYGSVTGLTPGKHGFHVHALGNLTSGCDSLGSHYNPAGTTHGSPDALLHHSGDLGNIEAGSDGVAYVKATMPGVPLSAVLGRSLIVHELEDDLGLGDNSQPGVQGHTSLTTGNAGARIACCIIGATE
jgi:superoxide dismutase, Cu-Zn family